MNKQSILSLKKCALSFGIAAMAAGFSACSEKDMPNGPEAPDQEVSETTVGSPVNIINDPTELNKYVTNYKRPGSRGSRAILEQPSAPDWSMPNPPTAPASDWTKVEFPEWANNTDPSNVYIDLKNNTNFYVDELDDLTFNSFNTEKPINLYVFGKLKLVSLAPSQGGNIYIAPGGKLELTGKDWAGKLNGVLTNDTYTNLYIYEGAKYFGSYTTASKTGLYVEGDVNVGDAELGGAVYVGGTLTAGKLTTNNAAFQALNVIAGTWTYNNDSKVYVESDIQIAGNVVINAQNVAINCQNYLVGGNFHMENNSELNAYEHLGVQGWMEISTQGIVYTPCLYVKEELYIKNCATLNIPNYIYCDSFEASTSGFAINMGGNALINANKGFTIQNKDWSIDFENDDESWSAIVADKFEIMEGEAAYITGFAFLSAKEYWDKTDVDAQYYVEGDDYKPYSTQGNVKVTIEGVTVKSAPDNCKPEFTTPESETPPVITEIVTSIAHTHDISATCVAIYNGKAYFSWHKRGTSIHGCLEAGEFDTDGKFALTSWMEVDDNDTEGGNNWDGNSAVSGADAEGQHQGQYDFNHLIVAEGKVVTVGDHAKKGGFIGAIALGADGNFGTNGSLQDAFKTRQLLGSVNEKVGRSGNTVVYKDGKYYIACAGGFQEYEGAIDDLLNDKSVKLGDYELTAGSAKHIAFNTAGDKVATLELNAKGNIPDGDDYWFNDTQTAIPATLKVRSVNDWLNNNDWSVNIGNICPIYGKNTIAMDEAGNVYVSAGKQGLLVYNNGNKVGEFSIADKEPKAGANGVAIDDKYVYVAYGIGGLYILNKTDLSIVSWYKSNAPEGYETAAAAASANYVAVDGEYIYVAYGRHGVKILKLKK